MEIQQCVPTKEGNASHHGGPIPPVGCIASGNQNGNSYDDFPPCSPSTPRSGSGSAAESVGTANGVDSTRPAAVGRKRKRRIVSPHSDENMPDASTAANAAVSHNNAMVIPPTEYTVSPSKKPFKWMNYTNIELLLTYVYNVRSKRGIPIEYLLDRSLFKIRMNDCSGCPIRRIWSTEFSCAF